MARLSDLIIKGQETGSPKQSDDAGDSGGECSKLEAKYQAIVSVNRNLSRQLVSFQANKKAPFYRWFKYKEGFSRELVGYMLATLGPDRGRLLDPFAGTGTSLFAASEHGWSGVGIELLPAAAYVICARLAALKVDTGRFARAVQQIQDGQWRNIKFCTPHYQHVPITEGAFPRPNEKDLNTYIAYCRQRVRDVSVRNLLLFAAFSILEDISYTRKDGQYLRWDSRAGRRNGSATFSKGEIATFGAAIKRQLVKMLDDLSGSTGSILNLLESKTPPPETHSMVEWHEDSSLLKLCELPSGQFDLVLTSPPYCNRYDYTRTYALELAFLGCNEEDIKRLRQSMLSCTVENREKVNFLFAEYRKRGYTELFKRAMQAFEGQRALLEVLGALETLKNKGGLNNNGIVRMVRNYFLEMSLTIHQCARVMRRGGHFVMINDNVQYAGQPVPVDLILTDIAVEAGLKPKHVWTLNRGKGNSSQQMGTHGRTELRKSVYVWQKS